jgi:hypothetical protein
MTETWDPSLDAQITSKMHELVGCMCVVTFKPEGDRRGMIERIDSLTLAKDFPESFERTQFRVHLTSGHIVVVPGSAISAIESMTAGSRSTRSRKKPGMKTRKARTKKMLAEKRKSIATKASKAAAKTRTRRAKEKRARGRRANERGPRL